MLHWRNLRAELERYLDAPAGVVYLVSPFISPRTLEAVLSRIDCEAAVIVTSWRGDHLRAGVSSLDTYRVTRDFGATLFINSSLHLKLYSVDLETALVGSANLTDTALDDDGRCNKELLTLISPLEHRDRLELYSLIADSILVDDVLFERYEDWLRDVPAAEQGDGPSFSPDERLTTYNLPHSTSPRRLWEVANDFADPAGWEIHAMQHDLSIYPAEPGLDLPKFLAALRPMYQRQPLIRRLLGAVDERALRFGSIKQWLKSNCTDVPVPHARELTPVTQRLLTWTVALSGEQYEVVVPGSYSQVLRRRGPA